jgi:NAD(P)-dependent dehydrogenase (short-subunit alcohol dehydrogenase family)
VAPTIVLTGASAGIGRAAAHALARRDPPVELALVGRDAARLARVADEVAAIGGRAPATYRADFAVLDEVRALSERIGATHEQIGVLVNNAGGLGSWQRRTVDGFDATIQVNHLAGFLLANLLRPRLAATAEATGCPARIVTTTSLAEAWGWLDVDDPGVPRLRNRIRWLSYGASKQANILFTVAAARYWAASGIEATCYFPGLVRSRFATSSPLFLLAKPLMRSPAGGADTLVWLATAPEARGRSGGYFFERGPFAATPWATDPDRAARLWQASLAAVGLPPVAAIELAP